MEFDGLLHMEILTTGDDLAGYGKRKKAPNNLQKNKKQKSKKIVPWRIVSGVAHAESIAFTRTRKCCPIQQKSHSWIGPNALRMTVRNGSGTCQVSRIQIR